MTGRFLPPCHSLIGSIAINPVNFYFYHLPDLIMQACKWKTRSSFKRSYPSSSCSCNCWQTRRKPLPGSASNSGCRWRSASWASSLPLLLSTGPCGARLSGAGRLPLASPVAATLSLLPPLPLVSLVSAKILINYHCLGPLSSDACIHLFLPA